MCVDAMGKLMMAYRWPLEAGISLGEYKAKVKAGFRRDGPWIRLTISSTVVVYIIVLVSAIALRGRADESRIEN